MGRIIEYDKVKDLNKFLQEVTNKGYTIEYGPHVVLEDHSELSILKIYKSNELVAYIVAHYITQYYRAVLSEAYSNDNAFLEKLLEIRESGEKWSIPVNPLYVVVLNEEFTQFLSNYEDTYPINDGEQILSDYKSRNPNYKLIPRVVIARLVD